MSTGLRRLLAMLLAIAAMLTLVWFVISLVEADATTADTCKELGFPDNLTADTSGAWGSVDFDDTEPTLTLVVNEGYEVTLCIKAGSANQGNGPEIVGTFTAGTHTLGHSSGKELSHYGLTFQTVTTTTGQEETTTSADITTTTASEESSTTTTVPEDTTTTESSPTTTGQSTTTDPAPTTTVPTGSSTVTNDPGTPDELPFTGIGEVLVLAISGIALIGGGTKLLLKGRDD